MSNLEVYDYKGRPMRLLKDRGIMIRGSRYATRKSIAKVFRGEASKIWGGSDFTPAGIQRWNSVTGRNYIRFGCHIFRNDNFRKMKEWALA